MAALSITAASVIASASAKVIKDFKFGATVTAGQVVSGLPSKHAIAITSVAESFTCVIGLGAYLAMGRQIKSFADVPRESLWAHMKAGWLHGKRFATQRQAMDEAIDCVTLYNARGHQAALAHEPDRPQSHQADSKFASRPEAA